MTVCVFAFIYFNQLFQKQHNSSFSVRLTLQLYTTFKNLFDGFGAIFLNDFQSKISSIYKKVLRMIYLISKSDVLGGCPPKIQA